MDNVTIISSVFVVLLFGGLIWSVARNAKKLNLSVGEYLNQMIIKENMTFILFAIIALNIMEAMTAASLHPATGPVINVISRFMVHLTLGFVGIVLAIQVSKSFLDIAVDIVSGKKLSWIFSILILGMVLPFSFVLPAMNVYAISAATGESELFLTTLKQIVYFWRTNEQNGIPEPDWFGVYQMSVVMVVSTIVLVAHFFLAILDGLMVSKDIYDFGIQEASDRRKKRAYGGLHGEENKSSDTVKSGDKKKDDKSKEDDKSDKKDESEKEKKEKNRPTEKIVRKLVEFFSFNSKLQEEFIDKMVDVLTSGNNLNKKHEERIAKVNAFVTNIENIKKDEEREDDNIIKRRKRSLRTEISEFCLLPLNEGGFELDLIE